MISKVSGSIILDPLSAAVPRILKSLLKVIPLILVLSWISCLETKFPEPSYLATYPSSVQTNIDSLSMYHKAFPATCCGFGSSDFNKVLNSISGLRFYGFISPSLVETESKYLKSNILTIEATPTFNSSQITNNFVEP